MSWSIICLILILLWNCTTCFLLISTQLHNLYNECAALQQYIYHQAYMFLLHVSHAGKACLLISYSSFSQAGNNIPVLAYCWTDKMLKLVLCVTNVIFWGGSFLCRDEWILAQTCLSQDLNWVEDKVYFIFDNIRPRNE